MNNIIKHLYYQTIGFIIFLIIGLIPVTIMIYFLEFNFYLKLVIGVVFLMIISKIEGKIPIVKKGKDFEKTMNKKEKLFFFAILVLFLIFANIYFLLAKEYYLVVVIMLASFYLIAREYKKSIR